jgi:hypothetical protein
MNIKSMFVAGVLLLTSLAGHAGVIYEWQPVNKTSPSHFAMRIEFDEATVKSGSFSLRILPGDTHIRPDSGLLRFELLHTTYQPRKQLFNEGMNFGFFDMDVEFVDGKFLTGAIRYSDFQTELSMASDPAGASKRLFTIDRANADYGMGDCGGPTGIVCAGGTGHIRRIPEPGTIALLALGLLGVAGIRRRTAS